MDYEIFMSIVPPTATDQHKGYRVAQVNGRQVVMTYRKKPQQQAHQRYLDLLKSDAATRCDGIGSWRMFTKAITVSVQFLFPHPSNVAKRDRGKAFVKTTRPDLDNMAKGLIDCLSEAGIIQDDSLIWRLELAKYSVPSDKCGVRITITDRIPSQESDN